MAAETYGTKGQPHFSASGAPAIDVDPSSVADYAALVGNVIIGTAAQRTANVVPNGSGVAVWDGLFWEDTTDGFTYKRVAGAWVLWTVPWTDYTPVVSGLSIGGGGTIRHSKFQVTNGICEVRIAWVLGTSPTVGDINIVNPVTVASWMSDLQPEGQALYYDASNGGNGRIVGTLYKTSSGLRMLWNSTGGGTTQALPLSATAPFTWTVSDEIHVAARYAV